MNTKRLPSQQSLLQTFEYNMKTGHIIWRHRNDVKKNNINTLYAGRNAGRINSTGKMQVTIKGKLYPIHRVIFKMIFDLEPEQVDHIDGNKLNNKIENLRAATAAQNSQNQKQPKNNTSGFKGVDFDHQTQKYRARIAANGKRIFLGNRFETPQKAAIAYREAAIKLHGEFARLK